MLLLNAIQKYKSFSIITKFLIPQIITLLVGIMYILFTYQNISSISSSYTTIKQNIIPSIEKSTRNIMLLKQIANDFTFATLSLENEFLKTPKQYNKQILTNLHNIAILTHVDTTKYIDIYSKYFDYTYALINNIIKDGDKNSDQNQNDMDKVLILYQKSIKSFIELNNKVKNIVSQKTNNVYHKIDSFHTNILLFGISLYTILSIFTLLIYKGLQNSFTKLISEISSIRQSGVIKEKLAQFSKNEFGIIAKELNALFEDFNQAYQNVVDIANRDKLTQLYNRVYMDQKIDELVKENKPFAIVIADIDHFKKINDTYGHMVGDKVLESFAYVMKEHLDSDTIVSRWGGEEFLILIPNCKNIDKVYTQIEQLRDKVERYDFADVHNVTASFGCTLHHRGNIRDTMYQADKALYKAKELGRNRVVKF